MIRGENRVDLRLVLKKSIESLSPQDEQKDISIIANNLPSDCHIKGDSHLLERALNNLIDNAVRHTPRNGEIYINCHRDETCVFFTIQDTGRDSLLRICKEFLNRYIEGKHQLTAQQEESD